MPTRVVVVGKSGQLASALAATKLPFDAEIVFLGRADLPSQEPSRLAEAIDRHHPSLVINAAAFTAVDMAEQRIIEATALNTALPLLLAAYCRERQIAFIHVSTDYVFDGRKATPYREDDALRPLNAYGRSKAAADLGICMTMPNASIIRTSWLFSATGNGFPQKIIAAARKTGSVKVVNDQIGRPTYANDLAEAVLEIAKHGLEGHPFVGGVINFANAGVVTWFDIARDIVDAVNMRDQSAVIVSPITSDILNLQACRPAYSVLDTSLYEERFKRPRHWDIPLHEILPGLLG